jgi:DNA-binding NarL/FixJ family response regulator
MASNSLISGVKVFIVDDHEIVRCGLSQFLNSHDNIEVCGEAGDANSAIAAINSAVPDIVIVDINLGGISGIDLIKAIVARYKKIKILALSMHGESEIVKRAIHAGARGYVLKSEPADQIIDAIGSIQRGKIYISEIIKDKIFDVFAHNTSDIDDDSVKQLTDREYEIFELLGKGFNRSEIAKKLNLTTSTIGTYRNRMKVKLNVTTSTELIKKAVEWVLKEKE